MYQQYLNVQSNSPSDFMTEEQAFDITNQLKKANSNVLMFLIAQTIAVIVWGAGISKDVEWIKTNVDELRINRYSAIDASKDLSVLHGQIDKLEVRIAELERK